MIHAWSAPAPINATDPSVDGSSGRSVRFVAEQDEARRRDLARQGPVRGLVDRSGVVVAETVERTGALTELEHRGRHPVEGRRG